MKKAIVLAIVAIVLVISAVSAAVQTVKVTGIVTSVRHLDPGISALKFTLAVGDPASSDFRTVTVYAYGALALKWDSRIWKGITLTVEGTPRVEAVNVIDATAIYR